MTTMAEENAHPNQSYVAADDDDEVGIGARGGKPPRGGAAAGGGSKTRQQKQMNLRVSISPKRPKIMSGRRRSSSHFGNVAASLGDDDDDDSDIEFTLDGAATIGGGDDGDEEVAASPAAGKRGGGGNGGAPPRQQQKQQRRRRRSSARFLRLSSGGGLQGDDDDAAAGGGADGDGGGSPGGGDAASSAEHLGEIYRRAIQMNAENKINANNSWGFRLIENMDKFIDDDGGAGGGGGNNDDYSGGISPMGIGGPRDEQLRAAARKMKSKNDRGRVNFAKASCAIDASVKIYSYRVDDVHLSSFRVLANLNRSDVAKDDDRGGVGADGGGNRAADDGEGGGADEEGGGCGGGERAARRRAATRTADTLETNMANINMSRLDSAYDIDPLFHKMSKSFDEGGARGLLLGNLGVSQRGCRIVFDSKEDEDEEKDEEEDEDDHDSDGAEEGVAAATSSWNEREIDVTKLASKLASTLVASGHRTPATVLFVPQLESLRREYAALEEEGYGVDERDAAGDASAKAGGRKRLRLYDAPDEDEKEAERSIHVIAMERSRGSVLGMSFDTNFRLSMGVDDHDDYDDGAGGGAGDFAAEGFGGEGEFAPDTASFGPNDDDDDGSPSPGAFVDPRSYNNTKVLLDALCDGDAFYDGGVAGGNGDYAFFDMKKFERATDGNLWAGSQHWKKKPPSARKDEGAGGSGKKTVMFDDGPAEKKERKKAAKKDRLFIDFGETAEVDAIFEKKKTIKGNKKTKKDLYQMPQAEKDFLLPPDANVDISQLTRLFSRPNAVVRKSSVGNKEHASKTVGFYDVEDNALGFDDDDNGFGRNDDGGFTFAYGGEDDGPGDDDADYNIDFDEVRKVEKIAIDYATVAKKVDVRRLKQDLWAELEDKTAWSAPPEKEDAAEERNGDDIYEVVPPKGEPQFVSFKETVDKMEMAQSQTDVTVSFYFICCLHLANEKGLKLDSTGLEDFMISLDDGSAPTFGTFGDGFTETVNKLSVANPRSKRDTVKAVSYDEGGEE